MDNREVVKRLEKNLESLLNKYDDAITKSDSRTGIEMLRLIKDTMNLIDNLDFQLMHGTYGIEMEDHSIKRLISVWEQNSQGIIRNQKTWEVGKELDVETLKPKKEKF